MKRLSIRQQGLLALFTTALALQAIAQTNPNPQDEAKVMAFLERYAGRWIGDYTIRTMQGDMLQDLDAELIYTWETTGKGRTLMGQAVYAAPNGVAYATSESYYDNGFLVSVVTQSEQKKVYKGLLSEDGNSVSWVPVARRGELDNTLQETFGKNQKDVDTITITGYENVIRNDRQAMMSIRGQLTRTPMHATSNPAREY